MKRKLFLLMTICFFLAIGIKAQTKQISISGTIDSMITKMVANNEFMIKVHNTSRQFIDEEIIISVKIKSDQSYSIQIPVDSSLTYLSFHVVNKKAKYGIGTKLPLDFFGTWAIDRVDEYYLFEAGDSVKMHVYKDGKFTFSGKGAEKLRCQSYIYELRAKHQSIASRATDFRVDKKFDQALIINQSYLDMILKLRLQILETYKAKLSREIYSLIYLDALGKVKYQTIEPLWYPILSMTGKDNLLIPYVNSVKLYIEDYLTHDDIGGIDSSYISQSSQYGEYLFQKEWNVYKTSIGSLRNGDSFKSIYNVINSKYSGSLRETLILICIRRLNRDFGQEIKSFLDQVKFDNTYSKAFKGDIELYKNKYYRAAFPFELTDKDGKIHKLSDYKGKFLVIDFWFTGCSWCKYLSTAMYSVMKQYKNNANILFITVSTDSDKSKWIESINTGIYTSPGTVNLYTNGLGEGHLLINYYKFIGAPQQLLIDKNGQIVSTRPPRPANNGKYFERDKKTGNNIPDSKSVLADPNTIAFMKLINDNL